MSTSLLDTNAGQTPTELKGHTALIYHLAFSPDGKLAITGSQDQTARLWEVATGRPIGRASCRERV